MHCSSCGNLRNFVVDSRLVEEGYALRRTRECENCGEQFVTLEREESALPNIIKRDGSIEPYQKEKVRNGLLAAAKGRELVVGAIDGVTALLETRLKGLGKGEVGSQLVGEILLEELRALDGVSAVRFASVFNRFDDPALFIEEASLLARGEK